MRRWIILFTTLAFVLIVDQVTKNWVLENIPLGTSQQPIPALLPYFQFTHTLNTGSAFGFLPQAGDIFMVFAFVVVAIMIFFVRRLEENDIATQIAIGMICGGAIGNALDRIQHGAVIDFIHYQIPTIISNVSNIADHAIVFGVIIIFITSWITDQRSKSDKNSAPSPEATPEP